MRKVELNKLIVVSVGLIITLLIALQPLTGRAADRSVNRRVEQVLSNNHVNGIVLTNGRAGQPTVISHLQGANRNQVVRADKLFPIASFQKLMTGVAIERLVQSGKLHRGTPLSSFFPQVPLADQVTVAKMMKHTSGLTNQPPPLNHPLSGERAQLQYALVGCRSSGDFSWNYTDLDFVLLAAIIQRVTGQPYRHYLTRQVLNPVGVHVLFYDQVRPKQVTPAMGNSSGWQKLKLAMSPELGAGDILCTPRAYWRFYNRVLLGNPVLLKRFLNHRGPAGVESYFGGTYIEPPYLHANGYLAGYSCTVYSNYQQRRTIMLFANNLSYTQLRALSSQLCRAYFGNSPEEQATINAN